MATGEIEPHSSLKERAQRFFLTYRFHLLAFVTLAIFLMVGKSIYGLTQEVRYDDVVTALSSTNSKSIFLAVLFTGLSYLSLIAYDLNAIEYIGRKLPKPPVFVAAFIAYAVGNTVGFGPLSGGAVRFRAYSRLGLSPGEIARVIAFVTLSFGLGLLSVSAIAALAVAPRISSLVGIDAFWLRLFASTILIIIFGFFFASKDGKPLRFKSLKITRPDSRTASRQFLVTAFDIACSASVLFVLLPETHLGWPTFFAIYAVAIGAGVISHVPAGLGVFEAVMLAGLSNTISLDQLLGSLVLYRLVYYILPLMVGAVALLIVESKRFVARPAVSDAVQLASRLSPLLLSALSMIVGLMLILSGVVPTPIDELEFLNQYLSLPVIETAHFTSSILGLTLVISARGLAQGIDGAWWVAIIASGAALPLTLLKAVAPYETTLLCVLVLMLIFNASSFKRHASMFAQALEASWVSAIAVMIFASGFLLFFIYRDTQYVHELWWQFKLSEDAPRGLRAFLGLCIVGLAASLFSLLRPARLTEQQPTAELIEKAVSVVNDQDNADANLVRVADKKLLFSPTSQSFIMYGTYGRSWIALADPIGKEEEFPDLVWQFVINARAAGCRPTFYQVSPRLLSLYADVGLRAYKLGELAIIDLSKFVLTGSRNTNVRQTFNKALRDGLQFSVISPDEVAEALPRLQEISDEWLAHHNAKEKAFSLGNFTLDYVKSQPVGLVHHQGQIVAFATLMLTETRIEATVDIMRFSRGAPSGTMDFLFVSTLDYLKHRGFQRFNLGMAPLSGMLKRQSAPIWDRIGGAIYEHGDRFYNFKGLKAFKQKFHPKWEPRYLVVASTTGAALALMDVTFLIGGGVKGMLSK